MYHGKILLPTEYPFRPPDVLFLTPNGRYEVDTKVRGLSYPDLSHLYRISRGVVAASMGHPHGTARRSGSHDIQGG